MKRTIAAIFAASCAFAGDQGVITRACGSEAIAFDVKTEGPAAALRQPDPGKALVYVIQEGRLFGKCFKCNPIVRVGIDGKWIGAQHRDSWLSFSVEPGGHHLCADLQSSEKGQRYEPDRISLMSFTAAPSTVYYFRVRATLDYNFDLTTVDVEAIDPDEGELLLTSYRPSSSQPRK